MATTPQNGQPPTPSGAKLVRRHYADRVLADLGTQRMITDQMIRRTIGDFDPDNVTLRDLRRMRRDPMIKMGLYYTKGALIRADWDIRCEDPAIAAAVKEMVGEVHQSWMRTALNKFDFGYQAAVKEYRYGKITATYQDPDTKQQRPAWEDMDVQPVVLGTPVSIPPEHAKVALKDGRFHGINTTLADRPSESDDDTPDIPADWALWFVNEFEEEFRNYYGVSRILPAYEPWHSFWFIHHMRNRHAESDADPALQVWYPPGDYDDPTDMDAQGKPTKKSNRDAALGIGASLRGGATIAWPSDVHVDETGKMSPVRLWAAEFLQGGENLAVFNDLLNDLRLEKLRACLVPEEALTEALRGTGSRATSGNRVEIFLESLELEAQYLDQIWNRYQIQPLVEANWGKDAPKCEKVTTGFQEEDLTLTTDLIKAAFNLDPNALPIDWDDMLERANVPKLSAEEQQEREQQAAEAQMEQEAAAAEAAAQGGGPAPPGGPAAGEVGPLPGELAASQPRSRPRKYEREVIHLSSAPGWARREGRRRDRNVAAISERLMDVVETRYEAVFQAAADALAEEDELQLSVASAVGELVGKVVDYISRRAAGYRRPLEGELASMYHASGMAELNRLGLSGDSWDVGRDEVQEWARFRAGELIKTIDNTVVEQHIRPWLTSRLQDLGAQTGEGIAIGTMELAQELTDKFKNYPHWMAERVVRTEARLGFNESAADMWERVGVTEVEEYDGLGGRTGETDEDCIARNGRRVSIDEFRQDNREEHPNGTLGAVPVTVNADLRPIQPGVIQRDFVASQSIYGVTGDGLILSEAEVGRALAQ